MCELLAVSSRIPTRLSFSLEALAAHSAPGRKARDGWGVALYQGFDAALYRETTPANDSPMVRLLEAQGYPTTLAISHLRHATHGAVTLANTQPIQRELAGRSHVFAHNGHLPEIQRDPRFRLDRFLPIGDTDSEHAFCALLSRLMALWAAPRPPGLHERLGIVAGFASDLRTLGPANFLYADGELLFAHAHRRTQADGRIAPPGLHWLQRRCARDNEALQVDGLNVGCGYQQVLLLASVPISHESWQPLAEGETVVVGGGELLARHIPDLPN